MNKIQVGTVVVKSTVPKEMIPAFVAELKRLSPGTVDLQVPENLEELSRVDEAMLIASLIDRLNRLEAVPEDVFFGLSFHGNHEDWAWRKIE